MVVGIEWRLVLNGGWCGGNIKYQMVVGGNIIPFMSPHNNFIFQGEGRKSVGPRTK